MYQGLGVLTSPTIAQGASSTVVVPLSSSVVSPLRHVDP